MNGCEGLAIQACVAMEVEKYFEKRDGQNRYSMRSRVRDIDDLFVSSANKQRLTSNVYCIRSVTGIRYVSSYCMRTCRSEPVTYGNGLTQQDKQKQQNLPQC